MPTPAPTPPARAAKGRRSPRKRKASPRGAPFAPWYEDEESMARVLRVGDLDLAGWTATQIAKEVGVNPATVYEDLRRMSALRLGRPVSREARDANRERSLDQIRRVQRTAWATLDAAIITSGNSRRFDPEKLSGKDASELLGTILAAEKEVIKLQGTTPTVVKESAYDPTASLAIITDLATRLSQLPRADGVVLLPGHALPRRGGGDPLPLAAVGEDEPAAASG